MIATIDTPEIDKLISLADEVRQLRERNEYLEKRYSQTTKYIEAIARRMGCSSLDWVEVIRTIDDKLTTVGY